MGIRRGGKRLPVAEIRQMAGRAGRSYTRSGEAVLVVPPGEAAEAEAIWRMPPEPVRSQMDAEAAAGQILPAIRRAGGGFGSAEFEMWLSRSLACAQAIAIKWPAVRAELLATGAAVETGNGVRLTPEGELACALCYAPRRVAVVRDRLAELPNALLAAPEGYALAWLMATAAPAWLMEDEDPYPPYEAFRDACREQGLRFVSEAGAADGFACWCIFAACPAGRLAPVMRERRREAGRFLAMLAGLCRLRNRPFAKDIWEVAADRRLPYSLAEIAFAFPNAPKGLLAELAEFGVFNPAELAAKREIILARGTEELAKFAAGVP